MRPLLVLVLLFHLPLAAQDAGSPSEAEYVRGLQATAAAKYADKISLPMLSSRSRSPPSKGAACAASGSRATPIRQPPRARLLLSAVVTTVRSGATHAGLRNSVAGSWTRSR